MSNRFRLRHIVYSYCVHFPAIPDTRIPPFLTSNTRSFPIVVSFFKTFLERTDRKDCNLWSKHCRRCTTVRRFRPINLVTTVRIWQWPRESSKHWRRIGELDWPMDARQAKRVHSISQSTCKGRSDNAFWILSIPSRSTDGIPVKKLRRCQSTICVFCSLIDSSTLILLFPFRPTWPWIGTVIRSITPATTTKSSRIETR